MKINDYFDSITPNRERITEKIKEKQFETENVSKNADVVFSKRRIYFAMPVICVVIIAMFVIVISSKFDDDDKKSLTGIGTRTTSKTITVTTTVTTTATTTTASVAEQITFPYLVNEEKLIPNWMQENSIVIYDETGTPTVIKGGELSKTEVMERDDINSIGMFSADIKIEPNTKVEYDLHGFLQNVYYLIPGTNEYRLTPPGAAEGDVTKDGRLISVKTTFPYLTEEQKRIPLLMQPYSVIIYDENSKPTVVQGGEITEEEFQTSWSGSKLFQTDTDNLNEDTLKKPNTKVEYDLHGELQNIYYLTPGTTNQYQLSPPVVSSTTTVSTTTTTTTE